MSETVLRAPAAGRLFTRPAAVASCAGFVLIGMLQALYGPAVPGLRAEFGLSPSGAGLGLSLHFAGGVAGVLAFNAIHSSISNRALLAASYGLMAAGGAGLALADWPTAMAATPPTHPRTLARRVTPSGWSRRILSGVPTARLGCRSPVTTAKPPALPGRSPTRPGCREGSRQADARAVELSGAIQERVSRARAQESSTSSTSPSPRATVAGSRPLKGVGRPALVATSVYWLMMTAGRFLVVPITLRHSPERILTVCAAGMTVCLLPALVKGVAPVAYAGVGLFIAPVFPTGLPWLNRALPQAGRAGAWVIAASVIGGVAAPPLLGAGIEASGIHAVPWLLTVLSAASLLATVWLIRLTRRYIE
ncbi:MFS transporter [Streptomyces sp. NPDC086549]|uniref:MFS transporter n=1 Tax=Streptomyces sp. NPDC086549 TaxID=3365752 RepID=UPI0038054A67